MTKILTTQNAQITTTAVEVRSLTISGKQVTLSVFRQLIHEDLTADEDGNLNGIPWGHVNYHPAPKACAYHGNHLHVVWQKGAELRRGVEQAPTQWPGRITSEAGDQWLDAAVLTGWRPVQAITKPKQDFLNIEFPSGTVSIGFDAVIQDVLWPSRWGWVGDEQEAKERARARALEELRERTKDAPDLAQLAARVDEDIRTELKLRQRDRDRWAAMRALPHLFIAV